VSRKRKNIALTISLLGFVFCTVTALGLTDQLCTTGGCSLYRDMSIFGINMYWFGSLFFLVAAISVIFNKSADHLNPYLSFWLLSGLTASAILLIVQSLTSPCALCLYVAFFVLLLAITLLVDVGRLKFLSRMLALKKAFIALLIAWAMVIVTTANQNISPVPIIGDSQSAVKVFFSPSCPSCVEKLIEMTTNNSVLPHLALYPIIINKNDAAVIKKMQNEFFRSGSVSSAIDAMTETPILNVMSFYDKLNLRIMSFLNKSFLAKIGVQAVPYVMTSSPGLLSVMSVPVAQGDNNPMIHYIFNADGVKCPIGVSKGDKCEVVFPTR